MPTVESQTGLQVVSLEAEPEAIASVDWWITSLCNLACDFCYGPEPGRDPAHLREQIALALAASPAKTITFCGGEPLVLGKEVFEYARLFKAAGKRVVLNTNGELLERAIEKYLLPGEDLPFDVIGISIEGPTQATHGEMRQRRGGAPANLAASFAGAMAVKDFDNTNLKIASVVSGVSVHWLDRHIDFVQHEIGPDMMRLYQYNSNGPINRGQERHFLSGQDYQRGIRFAQLGAPLMPVSTVDNESQNCLIVDPNGGVSVSTKFGYTPLGNCLESSMEEIWSRQPVSIRDGVRRNKRWVGSIVLGSKNGDHEADLTNQRDFGVKDTQGRKLDYRPHDLWTFHDFITRYPSVYRDFEAACVENLRDVLPPNEARSHWAVLWSKINAAANTQGPLTPLEITDCHRMANILIYYYKITCDMKHQKR